MSDLITAEEAGKLLDEVAQNQPRVCLAWCLKSAEDCLCYKAQIAEGALYNAAPDLARTVIALHADRDRLAAAIREAALREALEIARDAMLGFEALQTAATRGGSSKDVLAHSSAREAARQIFEAVSALIDNPRKEVVQPERQSINPSIRESDTAPAGLSAGGGADYRAAREAIQKMRCRQGEYSVQWKSADRALAFLDDMEARNCPAPRVLLDDDIAVLTWVIGCWKLYQYCDEEESQSFRREGPPEPPAEGSE